MNNFRKLNNIVGWTVFAIAMIVYFFSAERAGSLWDCGEFITGAYKFQVVHPPGAPLFLIIGRMFTFVAETISDDPANIAFAVNLLSSTCAALTATLVCWVTVIFGKLALVGRENQPDKAESIAILGAGAVAGLSTAFATSIWFSAVEGEVYAMSTFFTALTLWAMMKWYNLPDEPQTDRWLIFAVFSAGLSTGVHLLSILTFPALAMFYYFKKYQKHSLLGMATAAVIGVVAIAFIQFFIILGIPKLWSALELFMVNSLGMPFQSGVYPLILIVGGILAFGMYYAHKNRNSLIQNIVVCAFLVTASFSTIGIVVIRANANTPINMNNPSDPIRLIPYLNREQYGERPLLKGPSYDTRVVDTESEDRYGQVGDKYEIVDKKNSYIFDSKGEMLFPRMSHADPARKQLYELWMGHKGPPSQADNLKFFINYQIKWMYWRYFMWNFAGRQNAEQGYYPWDPKSGNWMSGIKLLDNSMLYNQNEIPDTIKNDEARNKYYLLPFLFGLIGIFFHFRRRPNDAFGLLALFIITGIGIIVYSNQPPNEPRERDYVLAGSIFTYCIWIGMAVLGLFHLFRSRIKNAAAPVSIALVMLAPLLMGTQNFDDHSRNHQYGARDYASNFLNSCAQNSIVFTYGDNDTYPLWYAQEVEGIRTDVRVVNLSLIAVDWYIDQLRRKTNDSPAIKMSITPEAYRGSKRIQIPINPSGNTDAVNLQSAIKFIGEDHPVPLQGGRSLESYLLSDKLYIPVNKQQVISNGTVGLADTAKIVDRMDFSIPKSKGQWLLKGDIAILDIIASNVFERPVYFAVTCRPESLSGLQDYVQLEGLALRIIPVKSPQERQFGMVGYGRVNTDSVYTNVMDKFRWGGFDKKDLFVNNSYGPSIQSTRALIMRTAQNMVEEGNKQKAVELVDKYFEAFPHFNFPYDYNTLFFVRIYMAADAYKDHAKPQMKILANEAEQYLRFFETLDVEKLMLGFRSEADGFLRAKNEMIRLVQQAGDKEFEEELKAKFAPFDSFEEEFRAMTRSVEQ